MKKPRPVEYEIKPPRTYANVENVRAAIAKAFPVTDEANTEGVRYFIMRDNSGRFFPVFIGTNCMAHGIHFKFNIVG